VLTRDPDLYESNICYAQGGLIGRGPDDDVELLVEDILTAGPGARSPQVARILAEDGIQVYKQGFGRLIRTQSDRGVVVILDKRVLTKRYGKSFLASLPGCTRREGPLYDLPKMAQKWLNL